MYYKIISRQLVDNKAIETIVKADTMYEARDIGRMELEQKTHYLMSDPGVIKINRNMCDYIRILESYLSTIDDYLFYKNEYKDNVLSFLFSDCCVKRKISKNNANFQRFLKQNNIHYDKNTKQLLKGNVLVGIVFLEGESIDYEYLYKMMENKFYNSNK